MKQLELDLQSKFEEEVKQFINENGTTLQWVDPPAGWKYGFPKLWEGVGDMNEWLLASGYPQREIDSCGDYFYVRLWSPTAEEELEYTKNIVKHSSKLGD